MDFVYDESGCPVATAALSSHDKSCSPIALLLPLARLPWLRHRRRSPRSPLAVLYSTNGTAFATYYYILNLQGDVVKLIGTDGSIAASYTYDAWGNILSSSGTMAEKNPLRYRGYYYDSETGYYYLQSRYYDPVNRRFLNADSLASTGQGFVGINMFAYCNNNPVCMADSEGRFPEYVVVDSSETSTEEIERGDEGYIRYKVTITYRKKITIKSFFWVIYEKSRTYTRSYEFKITNIDTVQFDNKQKYASDLKHPDVLAELAKEILNTAQKERPGMLAGRTKRGIENELYVHYLLADVNKHAEVADIGNTIKGTIGYDSNAWIFESLK